MKRALTVHEVAAAFDAVKASRSIPDGDRVIARSAMALAYFCGMTQHQIATARRSQLHVSSRILVVHGHSRRRPLAFVLPKCIMPDVLAALPGPLHPRRLFVMPVRELIDVAMFVSVAADLPRAGLWDMLRRSAITHCAANNGIGAAIEFSGLLTDAAIRAIDFTQVPVANRGAVIDCQSLLLTPRVRIQHAEEVLAGAANVRR